MALNFSDNGFSYVSVTDEVAQNEKTGAEKWQKVLVDLDPMIVGIAS
jgi:hypothetical protein